MCNEWPSADESGWAREGGEVRKLLRESEAGGTRNLLESKKPPIPRASVELEASCLLLMRQKIDAGRSSPRFRLKKAAEPPSRAAPPCFSLYRRRPNHLHAPHRHAFHSMKATEPPSCPASPRISPEAAHQPISHSPAALGRPTYPFPPFRLSVFRSDFIASRYAVGDWP